MSKKKGGVGIKRERKESGDNVNECLKTFWTICPYCCCIYEYEIVYHDCCLRCQNCKKAFHAVAINGPPPQSALVEGKEQYNFCIELFKMYYHEPVAVVNDQEKWVGVNSNTTTDYRTEDLIDASSSNIQRRRVTANHTGTSKHPNVGGFPEMVSGTVYEDDLAKQEIKQPQPQPQYGGEPSNVQMVQAGDIMIGEIESKCRQMADHLENGLNEETKYERECNLGELEFSFGADDIYVGLSDLW